MCALKKKKENDEAVYSFRPEMNLEHCARLKSYKLILEHGSRVSNSMKLRTNCAVSNFILLIRNLP